MKSKKPWQHKEVLVGLYEDQGFSIREMAQILGISPGNVLYWMRKFDIESRQFDIGKLNKGKKMSDEEREKRSREAKERFKDPTNHPMYGRKHTEASRKKMSDTRRRKRQEQSE